MEPFAYPPMDALHLACAITAGADFFLTTDKGILRKMEQDKRIRVLDSFHKSYPDVRIIDDP